MWFGAWKRHIAFYPVTGAMLEVLGQELSAYKQTKGSMRFPLSKPMPYDLIRRIVRVRIDENGGQSAEPAYTSGL